MIILFFDSLTRKERRYELFDKSNISNVYHYYFVYVSIYILSSTKSE